MEVQTNTYMLICRNKSVKTQLSHRKMKEKKNNCPFYSSFFKQSTQVNTSYTLTILHN